MSRRHTDVSEQVVKEACPVTEVLDRVAGKWSIGILVAAAQGPVRFTELERAVEGISRRMLTLNLRRLERDGLLVRTVYPTVPPKVEYRLTPMARELYTYLTGLVGWAERHRGAITDARHAYDTAAAAEPAEPADPAEPVEPAEPAEGTEPVGVPEGGDAAEAVELPGAVEPQVRTRPERRP